MADARLSDKELAQINAAAVTREYTVKPHLGMCLLVLLQEGFIESHIIQIIVLYPVSMGKSTMRSSFECLLMLDLQTSCGAR